ncbi:MAG: CDP-alcohol phosphatidyltransferase family protein [Chloroflexia bacterium]
MRMADLERSGRTLAERLLGRPLLHLGLSPMALTLGGVMLNGGAAALLALGHLPWAGGVILLAALCDAADGTLARLTNRQSRLGAFLDSTLDRYSEMLIGLGLFLYLLNGKRWSDLLLLFLFLSGSLTFSYIRARAEAEGFRSHPGLFIRSLRIAVLVAGLWSGELAIGLWVLVVGTHLSALHRLVGVCLEAWEKAPPETRPTWPRRLREWTARRTLHNQAGGRPPA